MKQESSLWPTSVPSEEGAIPAKELRKSAVVAATGGASRLQELCRELVTRKGSFKVVVGTLARVMGAVLLGERERILKHPSAKQRRLAEKILLQAFQGDTKLAWDRGHLKSLNPQWSQGLIVTQGRFTEDRMVALTGKR